MRGRNLSSRPHQYYFVFTTSARHFFRSEALAASRGQTSVCRVALTSMSNHSTSKKITSGYSMLNIKPFPNEDTSITFFVNRKFQYHLYLFS